MAQNNYKFEKRKKELEKKKKKEEKQQRRREKGKTEPDMEQENVPVENGAD